MPTTTTSPSAQQFIAPTSKRTPGDHALVFAELLTAKFFDENGYSSKCFTVEGGNRYDRIVQMTMNGNHGSVHAFVDKAGNVYKAAGWAGPAKGIRYAHIFEAVERADLFGSYLYKR